MLAGAACLALLFAGCARVDSPVTAETAAAPVDLKICISNINMSKESLDALSGFYLESHPEINSIKWEIVSDDSYYNLLKMNLASGQLPDIIMVNGSNELQEWGGHLIPLGETRAASALDERVLEGSLWNSDCYSLPIMYEEVGILYNMEILKSAGWNRIPATFQELKTLCADVEAAHRKVFINSYMNTSKMIESGLMQMVSMKKHPELYMLVLEKNNQSRIANDTEWNELMDFYDLTLAYGNRRPLEISSDLARNYFAIGKYAMIVNESLDGFRYMNLSQEMKDKIEIGPLLLSDDEEKNKMQIKVIRLGITKDCSAPGEATAFLDWLAYGDGDSPLRDIQRGKLAGWLANDRTTIGMRRTVPSVMVEKMIPIWTRYISQEISRDVFYEEVSASLQDYAKKYNRR